MRQDAVYRGNILPKPQTAPTRNVSQLHHSFQSHGPAPLRSQTEIKFAALPSSAKSAPDVAATTTTPYRLPKLNSDGTIGALDDDRNGHRVWGRHGYDVYTARPVELQVLASHLATSPKALTQELRRSHLSAAYPKFKDAVISPVHSRGTMYRQLNGDSVIYNSTANSRPSSIKEAWGPPDEFSYNPSPSPSLHKHIKRNDTTSAKSIHWALTQYRNTSLDRKGKKRSQGPFSREFTVHCSAPNTWMKMKYVRSKTFA